MFKSAILIFFTFSLIFPVFANMSSLSSCQRELWEKLNLIPLERSVAGPGFVGHRANFSDSDVETMQRDLGIIEWGQSFILVSSEKDILALESVQRDPMFRTAYLLVSEEFLAEMKEKSLKFYEIKKRRTAVEDTWKSISDLSYLNKYENTLKKREDDLLVALNDAKVLEDEKAKAILKRDQFLLRAKEMDPEFGKIAALLTALEKKLNNSSIGLENKREIIQDLKERINEVKKARQNPEYLSFLENFLQVHTQDQKKAFLISFFDRLSAENVELVWYVDAKRYSAPSSYLSDVLRLDKAELGHGGRFRSYNAPALKNMMRDLDLPYLLADPRPAPADPLTSMGALMASPMIRGTILASDLMPIPGVTLKLANSIKKLRSSWRSLAGKGYSIVFNKHHEESIFMLKNQVRKNVDVLGNSFQDEDLANSFRKKFKEGSAFTVEVLDPKGRLIGGNVGYISQGLITGESVFYDKNIDYAKYSILALLSVAYQNGITMVDSVQVTRFLEGLHGKYIPRSEFYERWKSFPKINSLQFPEKWIMEE